MPIARLYIDCILSATLVASPRVLYRSVDQPRYVYPPHLVHLSYLWRLYRAVTLLREPLPNTFDTFNPEFMRYGFHFPITSEPIPARDRVARARARVAAPRYKSYP